MSQIIVDCAFYCKVFLPFLHVCVILFCYVLFFYHAQEKKHAADDFKYKSGPVTKAIDRTLDKHGISRQQYHGKAFVGNHVKKGCKV